MDDISFFGNSPVEIKFKFISSKRTNKADFIQRLWYWLSSLSQELKNIKNVRSALFS
jgi:hypothetical protein